MIECEINLEIISTDPVHRGVVCRWYTDSGQSAGPLNVTVYPDPMPTGADLEEYLLRHAPREWLAHLHLCAQSGPADMSAVEALKGKVIKRQLSELRTVAPNVLAGEAWTLQPVVEPVIDAVS